MMKGECVGVFGEVHAEFGRLRKNNEDITKKIQEQEENLKALNRSMAGRTNNNEDNRFDLTPEARTSAQDPWWQYSSEQQRQQQRQDQKTNTSMDKPRVLRISPRLDKIPVLEGPCRLQGLARQGYRACGRWSTGRASDV